MFITPANAGLDLRSQAATSDDQVIIDQNNFSDELFRSFQSNIKPCETYYLSDKLFSFDNVNFSLIIHIDISSLYLHFEELKDFLDCLQYPPFLIFLSETRIKTEPTLNIVIPGYTFIHFPFTLAGGVGVYLSNLLKFCQEDSLRLKVDGCEDLWFDAQFPGQHNKFIFSVISSHPWNNLTTAFIESLNESLQKVNRKGDQVVIMGDINIDLNPNNTYASRSDYLHMLESNTFSNLITKPTRVTENSQTIIDHLLTNDNESPINPGVLHYKLADHFPIFC